MVGEFLDQGKPLHVDVVVQAFAASRAFRLDGAVALFPLSEGMDRNTGQARNGADLEALPFVDICHDLGGPTGLELPVRIVDRSSTSRHPPWQTGLTSTATRGHSPKISPEVLLAY